MTKEDFHRLYPLENEAMRFIQDAEDLTSKPIEISFESSLSVSATVKVARNGNPSHRIVLNPKYEDVLQYLIVNKCANIFRFYSVSETERFVPATSHSSEANAYKEITERMGQSKAQRIQRQVPMWVHGLINQVSNMPVQIQIDQQIHNELSSLREQQIKYLKDDAEMCLAVLSKKIKALVPSVIYSTSNAINYAWITTIDGIIDSDFRASYRLEPSIVRQGNHLLELLPQELHNDHSRDREAITAWARYLKISNWFVWQPFEDVPASY